MSRELRSPRRKEDPRLLTGRGRFVDDVRLALVPERILAAVRRVEHGAVNLRTC